MPWENSPQILKTARPTTRVSVVIIIEPRGCGVPILNFNLMLEFRSESNLTLSWRWSASKMWRRSQREGGRELSVFFSFLCLLCRCSPHVSVSVIERRKKPQCRLTQQQGRGILYVLKPSMPYSFRSMSWAARTGLKITLAYFRNLGRVCLLRLAVRTCWLLPVLSLCTDNSRGIIFWVNAVFLLIFLGLIHVRIYWWWFWFSVFVTRYFSSMICSESRIGLLGLEKLKTLFRKTV